VGIREKKPPAAVPLMTRYKISEHLEATSGDVLRETRPPLHLLEKVTSGASVVDIGQSANMLNPFSMSEPVSVFRGPPRSLRKPAPILPMAEEKLKAATKVAAMLEEIPIEVQ
jgi:hypothetical protein